MRVVCCWIVTRGKMMTKDEALNDGYWCVICQRFIEADEDGVIVHDAILHGDITFDEEDNPQ